MQNGVYGKWRLKLLTVILWLALSTFRLMIWLGLLVLAVRLWLCCTPARIYQNCSSMIMTIIMVIRFGCNTGIRKKLKIIRFIRVQKFSVPSFCACSHNFWNFFELTFLGLLTRSGVRCGATGNSGRCKELTDSLKRLKIELWEQIILNRVFILGYII